MPFSWSQNSYAPNRKEEQKQDLTGDRKRGGNGGGWQGNHTLMAQRKLEGEDKCACVWLKKWQPLQQKWNHEYLCLCIEIFSPYTCTHAGLNTLEQCRCCTFHDDHRCDRNITVCRKKCASQLEKLRGKLDGKATSWLYRLMRRLDLTSTMILGGCKCIKWLKTVKKRKKQVNTSLR